MLFDDTPSSSAIKNRGWTAEEEQTEGEFSDVSVWAIISLIAGIISPITIIYHSLFWVPFAALIITLWSFWLIHRSAGTLTGYGLLRISLFLTAVSLTEVPIENTIYRQTIIRQARAFFPLVIEAAKNGDTYEIDQLKNWFSERDETDDEAAYWKGKFADPVMSLGAADLIHNPGLIALANLGKNAKITYDRTLNIVKDASKDTETIISLYAVTYTEFGESKTFLIPLSATRGHDKKNGVSFWKFNSAGKKPFKE